MSKEGEPTRRHPLKGPQDKNLERHYGLLAGDGAFTRGEIEKARSIKDTKPRVVKKPKPYLQTPRQ